MTPCNREHLEQVHLGLHAVGMNIQSIPEDLVVFVPSLASVPSATEALNIPYVRDQLVASYPLGPLDTKGNRLQAPPQKGQLKCLRELCDARPVSRLTTESIAYRQRRRM